MKNKWTKRLIIALGSVLGLLLIANFGINFWIKYKLPDYLKNNSNYAIKYEKLDIDLATGNIFANKISIHNKAENNPQILKIKGSVDTLLVNSFGILDLVLRKEISISDAELVNPKLNITLPEKKPKSTTEKPKKPFSMKHLQIKNGEITVLKSENTKMFSAQNLSLLVDDFSLNDDDTENTPLPFQMGDFSINGKSIFFQNEAYKAEASSFIFENNKGNLSHLKLALKSKTKSNVDATLKSFVFQLNSWKISDKKIQIDAENILVDGLNTEIAAKNTPKKSDKNKTEISINIKNGNIKNSNFRFVKNSQPIEIKGFNTNLSNVEIGNTKGGKMNIQVEKYKISAQDIGYTMPFYQLNVSAFSLSQGEISTQKFRLKPRYSRSEFIKKISTEKDLFDIEYQSLKMNGKWDFISENTFVDAKNMVVSGLKANIFRSKLPPDDKKRKPMYSELLRGIDFPLYIQQINLLNSHLEYEEDTHTSDGAGRLTFADFNMKIQNLNSAKMKGKPTQMPVDIQCKFFGTSPMKVHWVIDTQSMEDKFSISGSIQQLSAQRVNAFVEPYLNIKTEGKIDQLQFDFSGNKNGIGGDFKLKHRDLKVSMLNDNGEKKKFLSAIVNMFVKTDSKKYPESVKVERIQRDDTKSFFNLFWKGVESGLVKTLVGETAENARRDLKK